MIDTVYQVVDVAKDTVFISVLESEIKDIKSNNTVELKFIWGAIGTLIGSIIGALVTIWAKKKEFQNFRENLNLQKQILEENKANNENKIKAELIRLKDLSRQYQLSLKRFDFDHLKEVLEFADDKNEKANMLKDFATYLNNYNPEIPSYVIDYGEYQEYVVNHVYFRLENIQTELKKILVNYPSTFVSLHSEMNNVIADARYLEAQRQEFLSFHDEITDEDVISKLFDSLFALHENLNAILEKLQEEFKDLDRIKREFIKSQVSK
jgi:gas vesicle protein